MIVCVLVYCFVMILVDELIGNFDFDIVLCILVLFVEVVCEDNVVVIIVIYFVNVVGIVDVMLILIFIGLM